MSRASIQIGDRFGKWTVIAPTMVVGKRQRWRGWRCRCECGRERDITTPDIRRGQARRCRSCARREQMRDRHPALRHGQATKSARTAEHRAWAGMLDRCYRVANPKYPEYGGRGITVCKRWKNNFAAFAADMGRKPSSRHSLDRIDNDGNYEPGNCRWATPKMQSSNTRRNHRITIDGLTKTLTQWSEVSGIKTATIRYRLRKGWSPRRAVFSPIMSATEIARLSAASRWGR